MAKAPWIVLWALILLAPAARAMTVSQIESTYQGALAYASRHSGIRPAVLAAIIFVESSGNPHLVSSAGAVGLMQLCPDSGGLMGYWHYSKRRIVPSRAYLLDAWNNIVIGASYLAWLEQRYFKTYPDTVKLALALAAYNEGVGHVLQVLAKTNDPPRQKRQLEHWLQSHFPSRVAHYVVEVLRLSGELSG